MIELKPIRVVLVDDHPLLRKAVADVLAAQNDFVIAGEADDLDSALPLIEDSYADIVILDLMLKSGDDLGSVRIIKERCPKTKILVFSGQDETMYAPLAFREGASGYVQKQEPVEKLVNALRQIAGGHLSFSPEVHSECFHRLATDKASTLPDVEKLTDRELQIFQMVGRGDRTVDIARQLGLSPKTVEAHRARIKEKLNLRTANDLLHYAIRSVEQLNQEIQTKP